MFGKSLFKFNRKEQMLVPAMNKIKESKYLIDFHGDTGSTFGRIESLTAWTASNGSIVAVGPSDVKTVKSADEKKPEVKEKVTPKGVYKLGMLHDKEFKLNTDPEYVDGQIATFKDKLALIKAEEYNMQRGTNEIASILQRMENRKKYADVKTVFEEFPYTTSSKIDAVIKENDHLQLGQVAQFMADMPKDAVDAMKRYNAGCDKLCGKQAVFYIIADKKDFKKSNSRRDPILLAQSPFGHFWQILGAWDDEMVFLEQL